MKRFLMVAIASQMVLSSVPAAAGGLLGLLDRATDRITGYHGSVEFQEQMEKLAEQQRWRAKYHDDYVNHRVPVSSQPVGIISTQVCIEHWEDGLPCH